MDTVNSNSYLQSYKIMHKYRQEQIGNVLAKRGGKEQDKR